MQGESILFLILIGFNGWPVCRVTGWTCGCCLVHSSACCCWWFAVRGRASAWSRWSSCNTPPPRCPRRGSPWLSAARHPLLRSSAAPSDSEPTPPSCLSSSTTSCASGLAAGTRSRTGSWQEQSRNGETSRRCRDTERRGRCRAGTATARRLLAEEEE